MLYAVALKNAPASIVAVLNYTSIIWAMLFGWLIWNDWPTTIVLIGAGVIIATSLLIAWRESRLGRARPSIKDLTT
jgi:drug/metabolite transporter (DMT)-like permease